MQHQERDERLAKQPIAKALSAARGHRSDEPARHHHRHHVQHQLLTARQHALHLPELQSHAVELDLVVNPAAEPQERQRTVRRARPPREIASEVDPAEAFSLDEPLRRQLLPMQVAQRQLRAAYGQLALRRRRRRRSHLRGLWRGWWRGLWRGLWREGLKVLVEQVEGDAMQGLAQERPVLSPFGVGRHAGRQRRYAV